MTTVIETPSTWRRTVGDLREVEVVDYYPKHSKFGEVACVGVRDKSHTFVWRLDRFLELHERA